jgi:hypothetical protein
MVEAGRARATAVLIDLRIPFEIFEDGNESCEDTTEEGEIREFTSQASMNSGHDERFGAPIMSHCSFVYRGDHLVYPESLVFSVKCDPRGGPHIFIRKPFVDPGFDCNHCPRFLDCGDEGPSALKIRISARTCPGLPEATAATKSLVFL